MTDHTDIVKCLYDERDHEAQGDFYLRHIAAMTYEGLHAKSAIAAELAHRDLEITRLRAEAEGLRQVHAVAASFLKKETGNAEKLRDFHPSLLVQHIACALIDSRAEAEALRKALAAIVDRDFTFFDGCVDRNTITYGEIQQARAALDATKGTT